MKKHFKKFFAVLCTAICLFTAIGLIGCNLAVGEYEPLTPLTKEEISEIRQMHFDYSIILAQETGRDVLYDKIENIKINGYYGTYGKWMVLNISNSNLGDSPAVMKDVKIGGIALGQFTAEDVFYAYDSTAANARNSFVLLNKAYENSAISKADLQQIAYYAQQK